MTDVTTTPTDNGAAPKREPLVRIEMDNMTLGELDRVAEMLGEPMDGIMQGTAQFRAMAALAAVVMQRTEPAYTFDQALALRMGDIELVEGSPESDGDDGSAPPPSPESGASTPSA
jgi:hypothetical protein